LDYALATRMIRVKRPDGREPDGEVIRGSRAEI
jgi:hypothetical protein